MREKHVINTHKGLTIFYILFLIYYYNQQDEILPWIYLAVHGSYGIMWCLKSYFFPDKSWERPCSLGRAAYIVCGLNLYWAAPYLLISRDRIPHVHPSYVAFGLTLYILGVFLHMSADMQKYSHLKSKTPSLLTEGLWSKIRNPNYLGELLIYLGFAILSLHWFPYVVIAIFVVLEWLPNMHRKDKSLSRYPNWPEYKKNTSLLIPNIY